MTRHSPYKHRVSTHTRVVSGRTVPVSDYVRGDGAPPTRPEYMEQPPSYLTPDTQETVPDETLQEASDPSPYLTVRINAGKGVEAQISEIIASHGNAWIVEKNIHKVTDLTPGGRETDFVNAVVAAIWGEDLVDEITTRIAPAHLNAAAAHAGFDDGKTLVESARSWVVGYLDVVDVEAPKS